MTLYSHDLPGGAAWSAPLRAGRTLTLTALGDGANVSLLLFNAAGTFGADRMNVPDTLKAQMSARIMAPMVLMSDLGLALASVTASSLDWHDCLGGFGHDVHLDAGSSSYHADRNGWRRSGRTGLVSELTKNGLDERDLHAPVNLFSRVAIDEKAGLGWASDHAHAGDTVTLRTELDVLVVLSTAPHPLDTSPLDTVGYAPAGVRLDVALAEAVDPATDASWQFRDESARALEMSRRLLA
ncbi:DUF1989 domain-containing protein [Nocardioides sp. Kera G14]|uniref:DUF1989 domain-containing protein n=1 Tax=Nocardioides sp. Kera G14 TaxID=2884264 RepID=UPI001D100777|nr:DUF1989 domain-containing protein [Nocardioides sp. Kera G14]UDY24332.1 DUF1989 domain-containing protein [Nocardioides sp. Kera G14]